MATNSSAKINSAQPQDNHKLDFGVILEGLLAHPESYVNFGEYWWTLKRMIADWIEENESPANPHLMRGTSLPPSAVEVEDTEVYSFLAEFRNAPDFLDWIAYVNPRPVWNEELGEEVSIEDLEWEESFL